MVCWYMRNNPYVATFLVFSTMPEIRCVWLLFRKWRSLGASHDSIAVEKMDPRISLSSMS